MACFSATQLHTLLWTSSLNRTSHHFKPNYTYRTPKFLFRQKPLIASFSTSDIEARTETKDSSTATPRELCHGHVPEHVIRRVEEVGYVIPTEVQLLALPFLYSGRDCVLHAQTGSGKTLAYLLQMLSVIDSQRSAVQALIVVPTRELGMQVTKVARTLAAKPSELKSGPKSCTVMALLDGGMLNRHKS
nr:putative chloroplast RNA helicase VDL' isoform 8 [Nicotiana tabacum]